ncbi:MAG: hypothetical protein Q4G00_04340 [Clostridia bacterium]|nr:hypothetical protein [Clostridia bacterium]
MERGNAKEEIPEASLEPFSIQGLEVTSISQTADAPPGLTFDKAAYCLKKRLCVTHGVFQQAAEREPLSAFTAEFFAADSRIKSASFA